MSSVLKPSLTASTQQNSSVPSQLNKPMHPQQGPPQSYGQPSNHHPMMSHGNPTMAHNHPTTHQPNHYSLNVPNASGHYIGNNQPIPASNHPVPNNPSQSSGQQIYGGAKNMAYQGGYQPNLGHPPNQSANQLPPVSQSLPATNSQPIQHHAEELVDRSQSNGTSEEKSNCPQENHVTTPKDNTNTPALPTQSPPPEKAVAESQKVPEQQPLDATPAVPEASPQSVSPVADKVSEPVQNDDKDSPSGDDKKDEESASEDKVTEKESSDDNETSVSTSEGANTSTDSENAVSEVNEPEVKEKSPATPKARVAARKPSKATKSEEESPKTPRSDPKPSPSQKSPSTSKSKRARIRTQPYQSPLPELEIISKITASTSQRNKTNDDKLIVFFKNEFLAVRNSEGSFYICQAVQNIYKSSAKIRIRWLSQDKNDKTNQIYTPDFYDNTDFDCILTNLNLERVEKGKFRLPPAEKERTDSILKRSLAVEKGEEIASPNVTEEHPDGLDLSLYRDENQLNKRKGKKRKAPSPVKSSRSSSRTPAKKSPEKPKAVKLTPKPSSKTPASASAKKETPAAAKKVAPFTPVSKKTVGGRTERAKRRSDVKVSPVSPKVDQKKAKALAKVARKGALATPRPSQTPVKKETKSAKSTPTPPTKAAKSNVKAAATVTSTKTKTSKRSLRK